MKKCLLYGFAALSVMALATACSEDENVPAFEADSQVFTVAVTNEDGLTTRAGRSLYSETADQDIEKVHFFIINTDGNTIAYEKEIPGWMTDGGNIITVDGGESRQTTIELKGDDKLDAGTYKAYAIGYTATSSVYTYDVEFSGLDKGDNWTSAVTATTSGDAEEIFAGGCTDENGTFEVTANGETFTKTILLKRQVAGTYGYFTNIPAVGPKGEEAVTLRLVAAAKNTQVLLDGFATDKAVNGKTSASDESNVFFNDGTTKAFVVYSINLKDWFTAGDSNNDDLYNENDTWSQHISESGVSFQKGSVFAGKFLVPFAAVASATNTLQLQLLDNGGSILRYWNVNLAEAQGNVTDVTKTSENTSNETSVSSYSILRNHLYTLGMRQAGDNGGENPDPDGDETDEDDPADLNKGQQLIIKVSGEWEHISGMVLD